MDLELNGLTPMSLVLLMPDTLFSGAVVSLSDPEHAQGTGDVFLEHAPAIGRQVEAWVEEQTADRESPDDAALAELDSIAEGMAGPELTVLADLLEEVIRDLPQGDQDVVLQSPEDLIFAQMFFPRVLARETSQLLGCAIRVCAVEMASLSLSRMGEEPAGLLSWLDFEDGSPGDTCFVFPAQGVEALATRLVCEPDILVAVLMGPGLELMASLNPSLRGQVRALLPVDFSSFEREGDLHTIRICYEMEIEGDDVLKFVQYASPVFVNRIVMVLAGEDIEFLKESKRNLMLSFLSLNALIGAVAVADPDRAGEWIGPVLGPGYVPLYRPGDDLPDMYDFDVLTALSPQEMRSLIQWPTIAGSKSRTVARALRFVSGDVRRRILEAGPPEWPQQVPDQERNRDAWSLRDIWEARRAFADVLHIGVAHCGVELPQALSQQLAWRLHRLCLEWRLRGPEVLDEGIFLVPFMFDFDSLAELSDRDMTIVLERWVSGKLRLETLGCALSRPRCPVLPKVLRNVSARRRQAIGQEAARQTSSPEEVSSAQHMFAEHVYFATVKEIIDPPLVIREQIDRYLVMIDEELDRWCSAALQDVTFPKLVSRLDGRELGDVERLVGREELLWSLQDAPGAITDLFLQRLGSDGRASFEEDLALIDRRDDGPEKREWRIAEARLLAIDAARLVLQARAAGVRADGW